MVLKSFIGKTGEDTQHVHCSGLLGYRTLQVIRDILGEIFFKWQVT